MWVSLQDKMVKGRDAQNMSSLLKIAERLHEGVEYNITEAHRRFFLAMSKKYPHRYHRIADKAKKIRIPARPFCSLPLTKL